MKCRRFLIQQQLDFWRKKLFHHFFPVILPPLLSINLREQQQGSQRSGKTRKKSGKFCKIPQKSGKSQGISFQNALNLVVFSLSWNSYFQRFSCRAQPWWLLQILILTTKISTPDYCKSDSGVFQKEERKFCYKYKIISPFGQGKNVHFHLESGKNLFQHFCQGKMVDFLPKVRENYSGELLGTLNRPIPRDGVFHPLSTFSEKKYEQVTCFNSMV